MSMSTSENGENSSEPFHRNIKAGDNVLIRLPSGEVRAIKIDPKGGEKSLNLGKFGSFRPRLLIGQPYGLSYEIQVDRTLKVLPPRRLEELEETDATNELIVDKNEEVQPLTAEEVEAMKKSGMHASDIINLQISTHATFSLKNEFSKEKYKKRKQAKFAKEVVVLEPTLFNIAEYWFTKDPTKIFEMRVDTLAQFLTLGNVCPGTRFLVVDETGGLLTTGVMERLGGEGGILLLTEFDTPPQPGVAALMNFTEKVKSTLCHMTWAGVDEDYVPVRPPVEIEQEDLMSVHHKERILKRKRNAEAADHTRQEFLAGEWDGLLIASQMDVYSIVETLSPFLAGSAQIVVYHPHVQVLSELQSKMRPQPSYLNPSITEAWLRKYQVLPGRTHPLMMMSGGGGYLLHSTYVYDNPSANSALAGFRQRKRLKKLENAAKAGTQKEPVVALELLIPPTSAKAGKEAAHESAHHANGFDQPVLEDPVDGL